MSVLTVAQAYEADRLATEEAGVPGIELMANAGAKVAAAIRQRWSPRPAVVLCGPGNNGGDGFVVARLLSEAGWPVRLALLGSRERLGGDAAHHASSWTEDTVPLSPEVLEEAELVVDALFGAGLSRPLEGIVGDTVTALNARDCPVVAVDIPSGVKGDDGGILGEAAVEADLTVTFFRKKPGHLLLPGRMLSGEIVVADIGIPESVLVHMEVSLHENLPDVWLEALPRRVPTSHKYHFGHVLVVAGASVTGAAQLGAQAALRIGAGLVSIACAPETFAIFAVACPSAITRPIHDDEESFRALLEDARLNTVLIGPGHGIGEATRRRVGDVLNAGKAIVLDADGITAFKDHREDLIAGLKGCDGVLTPHEGEFARLFPGLAGDKLSRARHAAAECGAIVLLKGADTVIAAPDGRATINTNAPPQLATAGAGDVLAGMIAGLRAQGVPCFEAASAAAWIHGRAAERFGLGLIAEDLPRQIPSVLEEIAARRRG